MVVRCDLSVASWRADPRAAFSRRVVVMLHEVLSG